LSSDRGIPRPHELLADNAREAVARGLAEGSATAPGIGIGEKALAETLEGRDVGAAQESVAEERITPAAGVGDDALGFGSGFGVGDLAADDAARVPVDADPTSMLLAVQAVAHGERLEADWSVLKRSSTLI